MLNARHGGHGGQQPHSERQNYAADAAPEEEKFDAAGKPVMAGTAAYQPLQPVRPPLQPPMGSGTDLAKHMEHQAHL